MTADLSPEHSINDFLEQDFDRTKVFHALGIDTCCGGNKSLAEACAEQGLNLETVLARLNAAEEPVAGFDAQAAGAAELADHIEATHHAYLRQNLPRLSALLEKVVTAHAPRHQELLDLQKAFALLRADLEPHLLKEERVLFPMIRNLETGTANTVPAPVPVTAPIRVMRAEHEQTETLQSRIRELTQDFTIPSDACNSYKGLMQGLKALDADLKEHIHKENEILFAKFSG